MVSNSSSDIDKAPSWGLESQTIGLSPNRGSSSAGSQVPGPQSPCSGFQGFNISFRGIPFLEVRSYPSLRNRLSLKNSVLFHASRNGAAKEFGSLNRTAS